MIGRLTTGWLAGHRIRTAQRPARCDYWSEGQQCQHIIQDGERYVEGQPNDTPGWGADRICAAHAGLLDPTSYPQDSADSRIDGA